MLEPTIRVVSIMSMSPEQDLRVQTALKDYANIVVKEADLIFQGKVNTLGYALGNNSHGKPMIYTDLSLQVDDLLRGQVDKTVSFTFRTIGGTVGGLTLKVGSMPEFKNGDQCILFLKRYAGGYKVVRGDLGKVDL